MKDKYDVIIIGAGIGGLICGTYLAKNGLKVLIVEKHNKPGGCVTATRRNDFIFDMGAHLIGSCNRSGILNKILKELEIKTEFIELNPPDRLNFNGEILEIPQKFDDYISLLKNMFPGEEKNIDEFFKYLRKLYSEFPKADMIKKHVRFTYQEFLDRYFRNAKLKGILSAQSLYLGLPPARASFLSMSLMMMSYLHDGAYYPKGGTQSFPDSILERFKNLSGDILLDKETCKIILKSKTACGIETEKGDKYFSNIIISNADAKNTFFKLVGKEYLSTEFAERLNKMQNSFSFFLLYVAVKDIATKEVEKIGGWHHDSFDINKCWRTSFYLFVSTLLDPSLAPEKRHIIEFMTPFPYAHNVYSKWSKEKMRKVKEDLGNKAVEKIETVLKRKIKDKIVFLDSATPKTIEKFTSNSKGSMYGWEMTPEQTHINRLSYRTPIKNLFLVGHWTSLGCGVTSVAISGYEVAKKIVEAKKAHQIKCLKK